VSTTIIEFFGYAPTDKSPAAKAARANKECPFLGKTCVKTLSDGLVSGACTLKPVNGGPVICCPIRLYAGKHQILSDVAASAFGANCDLYPGHKAHTHAHVAGRHRIAVFGKAWGGELRLPKRGKTGAYFVDWILARLDRHDDLADFVAIEVQSIDTTGNYRAERLAHLAGKPASPSTAGFNWENVNKRILPQIIYKGHVLRRENLCTRGLFFVCPLPVYDKIRERLAGNMMAYPPQAGALSFMWYDVDPTVPPAGTIRPLVQKGKFTTTIDQVALAFTSPSNLPDANVYEKAIRAELS
jgi:hypothetical protein